MRRADEQCVAAGSRRSRYRAAIARPTLDPLRRREDEHRAAEPTAEQARAESAGIDRQLDQQIELRDRDLVVVAQARVALAEELAGAGEVSASSAAPNRVTRSFSVTTCRSRRFGTSSRAPSAPVSTSVERAAPDELQRLLQLARRSA